MGTYSITPRPDARTPQSIGPIRTPAPVLSPSRTMDRPAKSDSSHKSAWTSDKILATAGLVLLLLGFAAKTTDPWVLWVGLPTAAGLVLYLCLPTIQKHRRRESWQDQRSDLLDQWSQVVDSLTTPAEKRYQVLQQRVSRLSDFFPQSQQGSLLRPGEYMLWLYLKLLLARDHLQESVNTSHETDVISQRNQLLAELDSEDLTTATRQSKQETVLILDQRVLTIRSRAGRIHEIESDLTRVEQWVALMHDQAAQHNTMGDAGRRLHFGQETLTLPSLDSVPGSNLQALDALVNSQATL